MMIKVKFSMTKTFHGPLSRKEIDGRYWYPALICHALFYVEEESGYHSYKKNENKSSLIPYYHRR